MKAGLSRQATLYMMKGIFEESPEKPWPHRTQEEIDAYKESYNKYFSAWILMLPQPILCEKARLKDIFKITLNGKIARLYPPFELNEGKENLGIFEDVKIPEGTHKIESFKSIPGSAAAALTYLPKYPNNDVVFCQGLRIDVGAGFDVAALIELLLEQIGQHTHQWWLRSSSSPFNGMRRFGVDIDNKNELRDNFLYSGAGRIEGAWCVTRETHNLFGFEEPLNSSKWALACCNVSESQKACSGLMAFHDGLASYIAQDDVRCVLSLCMCVEILGNKRRMLLGENPVSADKLVRSTDLVANKERSLLKNMFIDRGHIAHGRDFHILGQQNGPIIEDYIEATRALFSKYLNNVRDWPHASQLKIKKQYKNI